MGDPGQGIVHIIGPEQGFTLPGMTIVCGDSHTSTHGAFGAIAFGIGTSEVEHVLATQTLPQREPQTMAVNVDGELRPGRHRQGRHPRHPRVLGTGGGIGYIAEYRGSAIRSLSMEGRMTVCNMSIEAGAKAGLIAPDETTFEYLKGRPHAPAGEPGTPRVADWRTLATDDGATFDKEVFLDAAEIAPYVSWGTNPGQVIAVAASVPAPDDVRGPDRAQRRRAGPRVHGPGRRHPDQAGHRRHDLHRLCTNGRIEDLRAAAEVAKGRTVADGVRTLVVPGSHAVKDQAEAEGLDQIFARRRVRLARAGLLDVPGDEPRQARPRRALRVAPRTATSRAARAGAVAPTSSPPPSPPPPPSPATSPPPTTSESWSHDMDAVRIINGTGVPLDRSDVDTDQIIPSDWLKQVERTGFEKGLFSEWRDDRDFVLNQEQYQGASVLVAGPNFGTGSSREHAVWAIQQYGFQAVISPRFGDIFRNNSTKNGLCRCRSPTRSARSCSRDRGRPDARDRRSTSSAGRSRCPRSASVDVPARRLGPAPLPRGPGRHRPDPAARGRDHHVRAAPTGVPARRLVGRHENDAAGPWALRTRGPPSLSRAQTSVRLKRRAGGALHPTRARAPMPASRVTLVGGAGAGQRRGGAGGRSHDRAAAHAGLG